MLTEFHQNCMQCKVSRLTFSVFSPARHCVQPALRGVDAGRPCPGSRAAVYVGHLSSADSGPRCPPLTQPADNKHSTVNELKYE